MKTTLAWIALGLMASGCSQAQTPPAPVPDPMPLAWAKRIPAVPGAIVSPPAWLTSPHFDVAKFFALPPESDNAAPLYLDALLEFGPEMAMCFPWGEPERTEASGLRMRKLIELYERWQDDPKSATPEEIEECVASHAEAFRKLELAQERPSCVFAIGLDMESPVPHAQVSRSVARALALKTDRDLARGDVKAAVKNVGMVLRLSRDLRPRGTAIVQLISTAMDIVAVRHMVLPILRHPKLSAEDCRTLIGLLEEHRAKGLAPYPTGIKAESVVIHSTIHAFETGRRVVAGPHGEPVPESDKVIEWNLSRAGGKNSEIIDLRPIAKILADGGISLAREYRVADDYIGSLLSVAASRPSARLEMFEETWERLLAGPEAESYKVVRDFLPHLADYCRASATGQMAINGGLCAASVRLWRLTNKTEPTDLAAVCKAAGLKEVPIDPFSLAPFRLTKIDGADVVYSIGGDEQDDEGLIDSEFNSTKPGDFLFKLR